jgi:hypothetical protein
VGRVSWTSETHECPGFDEDEGIANKRPKKTKNGAGSAAASRRLKGKVPETPPTPEVWATEMTSLPVRHLSIMK